MVCTAKKLKPYSIHSSKRCGIVLWPFDFNYWLIGLPDLGQKIPGDFEGGWALRHNAI